MCVKVPFMREKYNNIIGYYPKDLWLRRWGRNIEGKKTRLGMLILFKLNIIKHIFNDI